MGSTRQPLGRGRNRRRARRPRADHGSKIRIPRVRRRFECFASPQCAHHRTSRDRYAAPEGLNRYLPASPFSDQGRHRIRLVLAPYDLTGAGEAQPAVLADSVFTAPMIYRGAPAEAGLFGIEEAPTLIPAWALPAGPASWLLRLHEVVVQRGKFRVRVAANVTVEPSELDGSPIRRPARTNALIAYGPYEVLTLKLARA